jgi:5-methylcytosine-specific restriction endonuclease McrA
MKRVQINRNLVYQKYDGKCAYCGCELKKGWHIDHIEPIRRNSDGTCLNPENERFENYNPSCRSCNVQKNSYTLEQFRHNIQRYIISLNAYSTQYKMAKKFRLIKETEIKVKFYFETI